MMILEERINERIRCENLKKSSLLKTDQVSLLLVVYFVCRFRVLRGHLKSEPITFRKIGLQIIA